MSRVPKGPAKPAVTKLKPCPFCGGPASMEEYHKGTATAWHVAGCERETCIAWSLAQVHEAGESADDTAKRWNTRAEVVA